MIRLNDKQFVTLKDIFVERVVDNMSTKDLVNYVMEDLADLYKNMPDLEFLDEAKNWLADDFDDTGIVHDTYETLDEARKAREDVVLYLWECLLQ